jgi:hypothetical protein
MGGEFHAGRVLADGVAIDGRLPAGVEAGRDFGLAGEHGAEAEFHVRLGYLLVFFPMTHWGRMSVPVSRVRARRPFRRLCFTQLPSREDT